VQKPNVDTGCNGVTALAPCPWSCSSQVGFLLSNSYFLLCLGLLVFWSLGPLVRGPWSRGPLHSLSQLKPGYPNLSQLNPTIDFNDWASAVGFQMSNFYFLLFPLAIRPNSPELAPKNITFSYLLSPFSWPAQWSVVRISAFNFLLSALPWMMSAFQLFFWVLWSFSLLVLWSVVRGPRISAFNFLLSALSLLVVP